LHGLSTEGSFVVLAVADTGTGMSTETLAGVFEPFFSTKAEGKGTGLGLATVYGIVTASGGQIRAYSEPGEGSVFRIYLPRLGDSSGLVAAPAAATPVPQGTETILLCEDDPAVRQMVADVLSTQGYTVLIAPTHIDAIALCGRREQAIDLVISDVVMPRMDGPTLIARLREARPGLKALLMSGYAGDTIQQRGVAELDIPFIEKPFTVRGIASRVREVLDAGPGHLAS